MGIAHRLHSLAHDLFTPVSVSEAEIREELECHVELRTLANLSSGMDPDQASQDAEARFGDFEKSFRDCCHASMGIRSWIKYVQYAFVALLVCATCWLAISMIQMQSKYESEITLLRERLASENHLPQVTVPDSVEEEKNRMSVKEWRFPLSQPAQLSDSFESGLSPVSLNEPWCNWDVLNVDQAQ